MTRDMLKRFEDMRYAAKDRHIRITDDQICQLVIADVLEDHGIDIASHLSDIFKGFS